MEEKEVKYCKSTGLPSFGCNCFMCTEIIHKDESIVNIYKKYISDEQLKPKITQVNIENPNSYINEVKLDSKRAGTKHNSGKPMFTCLPPDALIELGKVAAIGAKKYGLHNYRKGLLVSELLDAAMRHLLAAMSGEEKDPVDGNDHLASVAWNALVAFQMIKEKPELDDRYKKI